MSKQEIVTELEIKMRIADITIESFITESQQSMDYGFLGEMDNFPMEQRRLIEKLLERKNKHEQ